MNQEQAFSMALLENTARTFCIAFERVMLFAGPEYEMMDMTHSELIEVGKSYQALHRFIQSRESRRSAGQVPPIWPADAITDLFPDPIVPPDSDQDNSR